MEEGQKGDEASVVVAGVCVYVCVEGGNQASCLSFSFFPPTLQHACKHIHT